MEQQYNQLKRKKVAEQLALNGELEKAKALIMKDDYSPIFDEVEVHPESEVTSKDINNIFNTIGLDINIVNNTLIETASKFSSLIQQTKVKIADIKNVLQTEKERKEDLNMLCNGYSSFKNIIQVNDTNAVTGGNIAYNEGVFSLKETALKSVSYTIDDITGNGYEGNKYVYNNEQFINKITDTSNRKYINDSSVLTYYEYSRITANNTEENVFPLVNFDSVHAKVSIILKADTTFNTLEFNSENKDVMLVELSTSLDGQTYTKSDINNVILNSKSERFTSSKYIYGSGLLSFKDCRYVKLILKATQFTSDTIAFTKTVNEKDKIINIVSGKRSVIKINDIMLYQKQYTSSGQIALTNSIIEPVHAIGIFANEYAADGINIRNAITYTLIVNGLSYNLIPLNSNDNGKKIIRTTNNSLEATHVIYINETIKNATLRVDLKTDKYYATPFISDLKLLLGGTFDV